MTTPNINLAPFNSIDATYPIAGQDNDSQGFRTNYTYIVDSFVSANVDITGLWANVDSLNSNVATLQGNLSNYGNLSANVTTLQSEVSVIQGQVAPLVSNISVTVYTNSTNQMGGNVIAGATGSFIGGLTSPANTLTFDYSAGDFQEGNATTSPTTLVFSNWPNHTPNVYAKINALITIASGNVIVFPAEVVLGNTAHGIGALGNIASVQSRITNELTSLATGNFWFEFSTFDGGTTVLVTEKSHP